MSHELRTPLNGILGLSEAMQHGAYGDLNEAQKKSLATIRKSGKHLLELINDVLDLSKIEAGKMELASSVVSVNQVCGDALSMVHKQLELRQQTLHFSPGPDVQVQGDERRLRQILLNLLSNASKFTGQGGTVGIEIDPDQRNSTVAITVWDEGIGVPQDKKALLFEPFVQIDSSSSRHHEGTGLGLSLVARLVRLHGGRIVVDSVEGVGSRFTVVFPMGGARVNGPISSTAEI